MSENEKIDDISAFKTSRTEEPEKIIIKAVGVGGGGNNAVSHMYREGIQNVSFVNINTDAQALRHSEVPDTLTLGDGQGAGNNPEKAKLYAEESADEINSLFDDDTRMVFVTAGMGGGTGTGAGPVVAKIAKDRGLLTVGIVTIPFLFEGQVKIKKAIAGADEMAKYVDALLVINNERLSEIYADLDFVNAFGKADDTLSIAARSISELITHNGKINLDFADVDRTLRDGGAAIISTGYGEGEGRVTKAIHDALDSPLLKNRDIMGSKKLLFCLFFNPDAEDKFLMKETNELTQFINSINPEVDVIWGVRFDESLGDKVKITILAAGFDSTLNGGEVRKPTFGGNTAPTGGPGVRQTPGNTTVATAGQEQNAPKPPVYSNPAPPAPPAPPTVISIGPETTEIETPPNRITDFYGNNFDVDRASVVVLGADQLDNDQICDLLDKNPTYKRPHGLCENVSNGSYNASTARSQPAARGGAMGTSKLWFF